MVTLYSHPGYNKYDLFCQAAVIKITDDKNPIANPANLISNDEDNEESYNVPQIGPPPILNPKLGKYSNQGTPSKQKPENTEDELKGVNPQELYSITTSSLPAVIEDDDTSIIVDEEDRQESTPEAELLMAHHRFQHISFSKLQRNGPSRYTTTKFSTMQDPFMFRMSLRKGHQKSLVIETRKAKAKK